MPDIALEWKGDFGLTPSGDLLMVDGVDMTEQGVVRRLLTAVGGYVWHLEYGAGLPQRIGRPARERVIQAIVRAQMLLEASVSKIPVPTVSVTALDSEPGLFVISINYTNAITGVDSAIRMELPSP